MANGFIENKAAPLQNKASEYVGKKEITHQTASENNNKHPAILIVDDDRNMRISLKDLLEVYTMSSSVAEDGQQAIELLNKHHFDLVLLDINMPNKNGLQVMSEINNKYSHTDIIVLSGETSFENARHALRMGAIDFLNKPFKPSELIDIIHKTIDNKCLQLNKTIALAESSSEKSGVEKTLMELEDILHNEDLTLASEIINSSPAVAFLWKNTADFPVQFVSENVINLLGYSASEFIIGKVIYKDIVHPDDVDRVIKEFVNHSKSINFRHKPYRLITKYGDIKWVDDSSSIVRDEQGNITHYQGIIVDVTEWELSRQKMLKKQTSLAHAAHHDPLTELPNRLLLLDRMQQSIKKAQREKKHLALMYIDLDKFKPINDSLGHAVGDEVLKTVAKRLRNSIRAVDSVARIGGDEFIVLMESVSTLQDVKSMATKLIHELQQTIYWQQHELYITSSIGISISPDDTDIAENLLENADVAMYQSKQNGRNTFQFYQHTEHH